MTIEQQVIQTLLAKRNESHGLMDYATYRKFIKWWNLKKFMLNKMVHKDQAVNGDVRKIWNALVELRLIEALQHGPSPIVFNGDSVVAAGENYFESNFSKMVVPAIPGDTSQSFLERIVQNTLVYQPEVVYFDDGGNDLLVDKPIDLVFNNLQKAITIMKANGVKKVVWFGIIPLGNDGKGQDSKLFKINFLQVPELIARMSGAGTCEVNTELRRNLTGPDGWVKAQYDCGDHVHHTPIAYQEAWLPAINAQYAKDVPTLTAVA